MCPDADVNRIKDRDEYRLVQYSTLSDHVSSNQILLEPAPIGDVVTGNSKYDTIEGAEFKRLPNVWDDDLGEHDVYDQSEAIRTIKEREVGYIGSSVSGESH